MSETTYNDDVELVGELDGGHHDIDGAEETGIPEHLDFENKDLAEGWESVPRSQLRLEGETHYSTGRVWRALVIAALILLFLNADRLARMTQSLPVGSWADTTIIMSETWDQEMQKHELTDIAATIRASMEEFKAADWQEARDFVGRFLNHGENTPAAGPLSDTPAPSEAIPEDENENAPHTAM